MSDLYDTGRLDTTIKILKNRGLGVHADRVQALVDAYNDLISTPLPRTKLKPVLREGGITPVIQPVEHGLTFNKSVTGDIVSDSMGTTSLEIEE